MKSKLSFQLLSLIGVAALILLVVAPGVVQARPAYQADPFQQFDSGLQPQVRTALRMDHSPALRSLQSTSLLSPQTDGLHLLVRRSFPKVENSNAAPLGRDPLVALGATDAASTLLSPEAMPAPGFNFEGILNEDGVLPPDTNGDVGPNHYVQWVNLSLAIWELDRNTQSATLVYGPVTGNTLWTGFGGPCETTNDGDPIVLYDHLADRWLVSQFALPSFPLGPYFQCIAVSSSPDPTGSWYRYEFTASNTKMNDYPHFGVWPDGYYMTANQFTDGDAWGGAGVFVFERDKMLLGQGARMIYYDLYNVNVSFGGMLPSDLDGPPPPAGTPNYFLEVDDSTWIGPSDALRLWEFHADWTTPENSSFGVSGSPDQTLPIANFNPLCITTRACIPQADTIRRLDAIGDRLMHRVQYRNFGAHASLVANHSVDTGGDTAGVRWYELRSTGGAWSIYQQGTFNNGSDGVHRWMGSLAQDSAGNLALGYSASSGSLYPAIRYAGRLSGDPLGVLAQGEASLFEGSGSQTSTSNRWGDYSMLSVDPLDDCTFWYTQEYYPATSFVDWHTRIGSFVFPGCLASQAGTLRGQVRDASNGETLEGATIDADGFTTLSGANGLYQFTDLLPGTYTVTAELYGYLPGTVPGVVVTSTAATTLDFELTPLETITVTGFVRDGSGQGWPLYAQLDVSAAGSAQTTYTDPLTGAYQVALTAHIPHTFDVQALSPGYLAQTVVFTPTLANSNLDFNLLIDEIICTAPGYLDEGACEPAGGGLLLGQVFDANTLQALNGATVAGPQGVFTTSVATPEDPAQGDGFFTLFSPATGTQVFTATLAAYVAQTQTVSIGAGEIITASFSLPAGLLSASPESIATVLYISQTVTHSLSLMNNGAVGVAFTISEVDAPPVSLSADGPFALLTRHTSPKSVTDLDASAVYAYVPPSVPQLAGGELQAAWPTGLALPWGIGFDTHAGEIWLGDLDQGGGPAADYAYALDGSVQGAVVDVSALDGVFAADMAYDPFQESFWQVNVGGDNCLYEFDPGRVELTGDKICPAYDNSQRGLAFDPRTQSFYSGSWNDGVLYHFDRRGLILDSTNLNLNISGLAFNPASGHLFVLSNAEAGFDVYVVDTTGGYSILGGFDLPGLEAFQQAGLALDCDGSLWAINQSSRQALSYTSGESSVCAYADIPWLAVQPLSGSVPGESGHTLEISLDAAEAAPGLNQAQLVIANDTPYGPLVIPVSLTVDPSYWFSAEPNYSSQSGAPGTSLVYTLTLTNLGTALDLYTVVLSGNNWPTLLSAPVFGPVLPGYGEMLTITVSIPASAVFPQQDLAHISVSSYNQASLSCELELTSLVAEQRRIFLPLLNE